MEELTQKDEILNQIKFMKDTSFDEYLNILKSAISLYIKSVISFGFKSKQAKENIKIVKEMKEILKSERTLLTTIEQNIDEIDLDETSEIVDILDELNDKTYSSYDEIFNEIEISCNLKRSDRILRPRNGIDSLITNDEYKGRVLKLIKKV